MATPYLTAADAFNAFEESRKWYRPYDEPINEYERLQRNKPSERIDPNLPRVTDGTLAAINQETPKRIIQTIPTGLVVSKGHEEYAAIANYELQNRMIPLSCKMGSEIQKSWAIISKAGAYGSATAYCYLTTINGQVYVEWILPYVKDVFGEKGKVFMPDSNVRFMRAWYQKTDLEAIINRERAQIKQDSKYKSEWDLNKLADFIKDGASAKPADQMTPAEREKGTGNSGGYEMIHCFQAGKEAEFYSFSPRYKDGDVFRTKVNKDPRGQIPLDDMYWNIDHSNPRGRGQIELSGGIQNLMDQQLQIFQFESTYAEAPALKVYGTVNKASLKIRHHAIWDMGTNPANKVERDEANTMGIENFVSNAQFLQSKIYNLNSSQDNSISASKGDVNQSKTQAGVNASEARLGVSDNYIRKQFEDFWGNMSETRLNIFLAEMKGTTTQKLEGDELEAIRKSPSAQFLDDKGMLTIPYSKIDKVAFKFTVDASSSEIKEDQDNAEKLTEVLKLVQSSPNPQIQQKEAQILKLLVDEIGAEGTDDLFPELNQKDENGMPIQQPQQPAGPDPQMIAQMVQQMVHQEMQAQKQQPKPLGESIAWKPGDLTPAERAQALAQVGVQADQSGEPTPNEMQQSTDMALAVDKHAHDTELAIQKHAHDQQQAQFSNQQADRSSTLSEIQAAQQAKQAEMAAKQANKPSVAPKKQPAGVK